MLKKVTYVGGALLLGIVAGLLVGEHVPLKEGVLCFVMLAIGVVGGLFMGLCEGRDISNDYNPYD